MSMSVRGYRGIDGRMYECVGGQPGYGPSRGGWGGPYEKDKYGHVISQSVRCEPEMAPLEVKEAPVAPVLALDWMEKMNGLINKGLDRFREEYLNSSEQVKCRGCGRMKPANEVCVWAGCSLSKEHYDDLAAIASGRPAVLWKETTVNENKESQTSGTNLADLLRDSLNSPADPLTAYKEQRKREHAEYQRTALEYKLKECFRDVPPSIKEFVLRHTRAVRLGKDAKGEQAFLVELPGHRPFLANDEQFQLAVFKREGWLRRKRMVMEFSYMRPTVRNFADILMAAEV